MSSGCGWRIALTMVAIGWLYVLGTMFPLTSHGRGYRDLKCKAQMKGFEIAIKGYKMEYLKLPDIRAATSDSVFLESRGELLNVLLATDATKNAREIPFWEPPQASANGAGFSINSNNEPECRDVWGKNFYRIQTDVDGDGRIPNPSTGKRPHGEGDTLNADVIVYSAGPDGDFGTWKDNIAGWR